MFMEANADKLDKLHCAVCIQMVAPLYDHIAENVGLSPSAVLRRVKRMSEMGVINRYVALAGEKRLGWV